MKKNWVLYGIVIALLVLLGWWVLQQGLVLEAPNNSSTRVQDGPMHFWDSILEGITHPLSIFLLQILTILSIARLLGWLMGKMGQPSVVGEIVAGILLGPSLLGWLAPDFSSFLFAPNSLGNLQLISQLGLVLFMFTVGMELDLRVLRKSALDVIFISQSSIIVPYVGGIVLAWILYQSYAPEGIGFLAFALFIGIAMSITAFPVLARITQERGLNKTPLGSLALAAAAINDVLAWCILAAIIAMVRTGPAHSALLTIGLSILYVLFMLYAVQPLLARVANRFFSYETMNRSVIAVIFAVLVFSALMTEIIGIHALFGAFLAGVIIPQNEAFRHVVINKIEDLTVVLLLPLFFVFTGLRTQIGLLNTPELWQTCGLIILFAVLGKFIGSAVPARISGQTWYDSLALGALMNTRGLMELIVLNIGFDLGILSPEVFAMMVLMALATTFMTGPALNVLQWFQRKFGNEPDTIPVAPEQTQRTPFRLLISFGQPKAGVRLLQLAQQLHILGETHALHFTPNADISIAEAEIFEKEGFEPILGLAERYHLPLQTHYKASNNVPQEIIQHANRGGYNLMLIGSSRPLFSSDETGGMVQTFFESIDCAIGVLIDKGFVQIKKVLMVYYDEQDVYLLNLLHQCFERENMPQFKVLSYEEPTEIAAPYVAKGNWVVQSNLEMNTFREYDLLILSRNFWEIIKLQRYELMAYAPSILILHPGNEPKV
jgi:Kef-type K+ transport system membrane component KefB